MILSQLYKKLRSKKIRKVTKSPALKRCPQKSGVVLKIMIRKPKKPNSANRKIAKVSLFSTKKEITCYIPGEGHELKPYSEILIKGGRVSDMPGVNYHLVRGKLDLGPVKNRLSSRSKYGVKKNSNETKKFKKK